MVHQHKFPVASERLTFDLPVEVGPKYGTGLNVPLCQVTSTSDYVIHKFTRSRSIIEHISPVCVPHTTFDRKGA